MKWFDRWFVRKCKWAWENKHHIDNEGRITPIRESEIVEEDPHSLNDGLRINIKKVIGGSLVTFRHYDRKIDRHEHKTYIITSDQDFNLELGKIITMESLR
jgi:hypothetical protein